MTRPMHPADVLELSLAGVVTAEWTDGLLSAIASLRAASGAIVVPRGLRARRGALIAGAAPHIADRSRATLSRRVQAMLLAGTLAVVASISFVGASVGISWLRDVLPAGPAPQVGPSLEADRRETPSPSPTVTPTPAPEPAELDALEQAPRRMPPDDEVDEDDESPDDHDEEADDETGEHADDAQDESED